MKLFIGLGNPGTKFKNNRHNIGFAVIDKLQTEISKSKFLISKSTNFMNDSGSFVAKLIKNCKLKIENLVVVHDDLDIKLGDYKIQFGKGPKEHNGLKSIDQELGTDQYWHVRVGIENRQQALGTRIKGEDYVLEDFTEEEKITLDKVIKEICKRLATL